MTSFIKNLNSYEVYDKSTYSYDKFNEVFEQLWNMS